MCVEEKSEWAWVGNFERGISRENLLSKEAHRKRERKEELAQAIPIKLHLVHITLSGIFVHNISWKLFVSSKMKRSKVRGSEDEGRGDLKKMKKSEWTVPTFLFENEKPLPLEDLLGVYKDVHLALVRGVKTDVNFGLKDVFGLFQKSKKSLTTWQREVSRPIDASEDLPDAKSILLEKSGGNYWYYSFIIDLNDCEDESPLPLPLLPFSSSKSCNIQSVRYSNDVWVFVGENGTSSVYDGRVSHTDDIPHHVRSRYFPSSLFLISFTFGKL